MEIQRFLIWTFMVQMSNQCLISSCFWPIDIITFCYPWWPQLHSTYHQPQVSSIYFWRFLWIFGQCDRIGRLLSSRQQLFLKIKPKYLVTFGLLWNTLLFKKKLLWLLFGHLRKFSPTFYSNISSLCFLGLTFKKAVQSQVQSNGRNIGAATFFSTRCAFTFKMALTK